MKQIVSNNELIFIEKKQKILIVDDDPFNIEAI